MEKAIGLAEEAFEQGEIPVGSVLAYGPAVVASAHNSVFSLSDPTAHSEMICLREGARLFGKAYLTKCSLYVTLEPCPMCAQAISFSRLEQLVFGAYAPKGGGVEHGARIFQQRNSYKGTNIIGGVLEQKCSQLLKAFFYNRRQGYLLSCS